ncbi:carbonic anhydrase 2-like [Haematobia irritans]|uniref:carbonic anhydrase 2-like n=1 Tax=Haematobia irritans TaxID=7368 RepID=UPI003F50252E
MTVKFDVLKAFLIISLTSSGYTHFFGKENDQWSYYDAHFWGERFPGCYGYWQSPLHLVSSETIQIPLPQLQFVNYDVPLRSIVLNNTGKTVQFKILPTINGVRPLIKGGILNGIFEAVDVHFHWGSRKTKGSEHVIDNYRFDGEIHINHRNIKYRTMEEAARYSDGLAGLAIMMEVSNNPSIYPGLQEIFNSLPNCGSYGSSITLQKSITMANILGNVDTRRYFTYKGSTTTPNCSEAITWHVFPQPLFISSNQMQRFWALRDTQGSTIVNNFRPIQNHYERPIFYTV